MRGSGYSGVINFLFSGTFFVQSRILDNYSTFLQENFSVIIKDSTCKTPKCEIKIRVQGAFTFLLSDPSPVIPHTTQQHVLHRPTSLPQDHTARLKVPVLLHPRSALRHARSNNSLRASSRCHPYAALLDGLERCDGDWVAIGVFFCWSFVVYCCRRG